MSEERPRVGLIVVDDGLYTHRWVSAVIRNPRTEVVFVTCISPYRARNFNPESARGFWHTAASRLRYYGPLATTGFALLAVRALVLDCLTRIGLCCCPQSVATLARLHGIPSLPALDGDVNSPAFLERITSKGPDILVCSFSQKASRELLEVPRYGCLNIHFSLLPHHRGREPMFHALLAGKGAGVSVHKMTPEFDAGPVVAQEPLDLTECRTLHKAILRATELAAEVVPAAIELAISPSSEERVGTNSKTPTNTWPTAEDVSKFKRAGIRFI